MKKITLLTLNLFFIFANTACVSGPGTDQDQESQVRTALGYTVPQAREVMATNPNPYDISIAECYSQDGTYIPELNQLRLRLINDYTSRSGKKFIEEYRFQTLYPRRY